MYFFQFILILSFLKKTSSEFYSSTDKLRELFTVESEILTVFANISNEIKEIEKCLEAKLRPWLAEHVAAEEDVEKYVTNPINAFLLLKRNFYDIEVMQNRLMSFVHALQVQLESLERKKVVEINEVTGAVAGILRVQRTYHLKSEELIEGIIDGKKTRESLTAHEVFVIADKSNQFPDETYFTKTYFNILADKLKSDKIFRNETNETEIYDKLKQLKSKPIENPFDETFNVKTIGTMSNDRILTRTLCRGNLTRSPRETKNLRCRFIGFSPFSSIAPFKLEVISADPYIVLYHEMISNLEIDALIELARPKRGKAAIGVGEGKTVDHDRLAQSSWLKDNEHELIRRLSKRFEDMTGLTMETAEALQVQNYGVGGLYNPHYDINWDRKDESSETRIATLMIYLTNVEKGGATVFPYLKLQLQPVKGSAVFWYNLKHSGHNDHLTLHSGCPVLMGSKWVANKWIRNSGQEFKKPCKTEKFEVINRDTEIRKNFL